MKRSIFLSIIVFFLGFLTHALFFPDMLANGLDSFLPKDTAIDPQVNTAVQNNNDHGAFLTQIEYVDGQFSRHNITIEVGSYLTITNTNKDNQLMWLYSNNKLLSTNRGYGESEQIRVRMDEKGQYAVIDKNNPKEKLIVTVK
jgi:hypothetical protein